jgi:hypothetical protein
MSAQAIEEESEKRNRVACGDNEKRRCSPRAEATEEV